jgi:uncharacterized membrane protein YraQ (UPF0718 family)
MSTSVNPQRTQNQDVWMYRLVIAILGILLIVIVSGAIMLTASDKAIPDFMISFGSYVIGAFTGLLVPVPPRRQV